MIDLDELGRLLTTGSPVPWECEDDGKTKKIASSDALIACALRKAAPELIAKARLGQIAIRFIDRANDVADCDPAERILSEWAMEVNAVLAAMQEEKL